MDGHARLVARRGLDRVEEPRDRSSTTLDRPTSTTTSLATVASTLRRPGAPLDPAVRGGAERHFGVDLGGVRIHVDDAAAASASAIGARAYSVGPHLAFARGRYAPTTAAGRDLLYHELAHVLQRGPDASTPTGPLELGEAGSLHERSAAAAAIHGGAPIGPRLAAHVVARAVDDDEEDESLRLETLVRRATESPPPKPEPKGIRFVRVHHERGDSGLTAAEGTKKRKELAGGAEITDETTRSVLANSKGVAVSVKEVATRKIADNVVKVAEKRPTGFLPDGTEVAHHDAELIRGRSEKITRAFSANRSAISDTATHKSFVGSKRTISGFDARGDFRENEAILGVEDRRTTNETRYRSASGRDLGIERSRRAQRSEGETQINLRNTGTKNQALDLSRGETHRGRRSDRLTREFEHPNGARSRDTTATRTSGTTTTREESVRLAGGKELKVTSIDAHGTSSTEKTSANARERSSGHAYTGKANYDYARGHRFNQTFSHNAPGAKPIAPRVQEGARIVGGDLGLVRKTAPDPRTVIAGDVDGYNAGADVSYTESLAFDGGSRVSKSDDYEVSERGVAANINLEGERGTLRSFLRKDRFNFGWLVVENAISDYYLAGASGKAKAGVKAGVDVNNVNASVSGSLGYTRRVGEELTFRVGDLYAKVKGEADAFAGIEAALSIEGGHTRGAGGGAGVNASAFAGARAGLGGRIEGGYAGVSFAAGAYKLRGSLGAGFKANVEARIEGGQLRLAGGLALSAELGLGADVELRINPLAVAAAAAKKAAGIADSVSDPIRRIVRLFRGGAKG